MDLWIAIHRGGLVGRGYDEGLVDLFRHRLHNVDAVHSAHLSQYPLQTPIPT